MQTKFIRTKDLPFMKPYIQDLMYFHDLSKDIGDILCEMLNWSIFVEDKGSMRIGLNSYIRKEFINDFNIKNDRAFKDILAQLIEKDILRKIGTGTYELNSLYFGNKDWRRLKDIHLSAQYNKKCKVKRVIKFTYII